MESETNITRCLSRPRGAIREQTINFEVGLLEGEMADRDGILIWGLELMRNETYGGCVSLGF